MEAHGLVLLCGGLDEYLNVSYLISAVVLGYIVAKRARHHTRAFHEIEDIEWPFIILFFVLRITGRIAGAWLGGTWFGSSKNVKLWMGPCLLTQAGIATGLALLAASQFPRHANMIVSVVVVATIVFEVFGPLITRFSLSKVKSQR